MAAMTDSSDWPRVFAELKEIHDEAFFVIEKAIKLEEEGNCSEAFSMYERGLLLIDKALQMPIVCPPDPDITWEKAAVMVQKIKKTRKEVLCRIADGQTSSEPAVAPPPSYDEAMSTSSSEGATTRPEFLITYHDLGNALQNLKVETEAQTAKILYTQQNVRIYFITPDGTVSAPSALEVLRIVQMQDDADGNQPRAYLQVGGWIYPLIPGVSPVYRTNRTTFILPDVHSSVEGNRHWCSLEDEEKFCKVKEIADLTPSTFHPIICGASVGLTLPEDADDSVFDILEDILQGIVTREPVGIGAATTRRQDYSYSISRGLVKGAQFISTGLIKGAEKAGEYMNYGTPKLIQKINPEPVPKPVNPNVAKGLHVAKNVTGTAVHVTGFVATKVGQATMALGRFLAPHIQRQGTRLLTTTCKLSEQEASKKMEGVLEVAAGAVEGFSTVYDGLERSAGILATNLANNTVKVVEHKYGHSVGEATGDTLYTMGNVFVAGQNIRHFTPKGLAKVTAKATGKAVVEDYRKSLKDDQNQNGPGPSSGAV